MFPRAVLLAAVFSAATRLVLAQIPAEERIRITDPDRLERMGFPRDAGNVFVWSKAKLAGGALLDEKAAAAPETWGPATGYSTVLGSDLQEQTHDMGLDRSSDGETTCTDEAYSFAGGGFATAQIKVPDGARLGSLRFWAYDAADPRDLVFRTYEVCQPGAGPATNTLIGEAQTFLAIGDYAGFVPLDDLAVNNLDCAYVVRVIFANLGEDCIGDLRVRKLQLTWTRQVSPAPATASFNDVPTDHPFFQFIEALSKSGTTAGCQVSPPLYCPDRPITRGEMAVYLAKALGLQWP